MIRRAFRSFLAEPAVPDPPRRVWRDWFVAAAIILGSIVELIVRDDVPWEWATLALCAVVAPAVFWRRTHPLPAVIFTFGLISVASIAIEITDGRPMGFYSLAWILVVPYSAFRWGSGRVMAICAGVMLASWVVGISVDQGTVGDAIGGLLVLLVAGGSGWEVRELRARRNRAITEARTTEREQIARELHDTVAHHVSAIAVQAQAGRSVAPTNPDAALEALVTIEEAASRTLDEMRSMVAALRTDGADAELAPQRGVFDITSLAAESTTTVPVEVQLAGDLDDLRPALDAALFRLAQESVTNASRHAIGASTIEVTVRGEPDCVRLSVVDDGAAAPAGDVTGYGLVGMKERAKLLGGALSAGPLPQRGWRVDAVLPRAGATR